MDSSTADIRMEENSQHIPLESMAYSNDSIKSSCDQETKEIKEEEVTTILSDNDLPDFATPEARKINKDIKVKTQKIKEIDSKISDIDNRILEGQIKLKQVENEMENLNLLLDAKKKQIETENHLQALAAREVSKIAKERIEVQSQISRVNDEINQLQNQIATRKSKLYEYKNLIKLSDEDLNTYTDQLNQNEEDMSVLESYSNSDSKKLISLRRELEKKSMELVTVRAEEVELHSQLQVKKVEIDHMLHEYAELQKGRQFVLIQWEKSLLELKTRDQQIENLRGKLSAQENKNSETMSALVVEENRLKDQLQMNSELDKSIDEMTVILSTKREEVLTHQANLKSIQIDAKAVQNEVIFLKHKINIRKDTNKLITQDIDKKKIVYAREQERLSRITEQLESAKLSSSIPEQTVAMTEKELEDAEKEYELKLLNIKRLQETLSKDRHTANQLKEQELAKKTELESITNRSKMYYLQMSKLEEELDNQETVLMHADQKLQEIENKMAATGLGVRSNTEKKIFQERMTMLEEDEVTAKDRRRGLKSKVHKLENEILQVRKSCDVTHKEIVVLNDKVQDMTLENSKIETQLDQDTRTKEELLVHNDLLLLNVRKLRESVSTGAEAVYEAMVAKEAQDCELERELQEKTAPLNMLKAEVKLLNEQKHRVILDLNAKRTNLSKLQARYDVILGSAKVDGLSEVERAVLAVRQKEERVCHVEAMKIELARVEAEVESLQQLLTQAEESNLRYKESLIQMNPVALERRKMKELEKELYSKKEGLRKLKADLDMIVLDEKDKLATLDTVEKELTQVQELEESLLRESTELEAEISALRHQHASLDTDISRLTGSTRLPAPSSIVSERHTVPPIFSDELDPVSNSLVDGSAYPETQSDNKSESVERECIDIRSDMASADRTRNTTVDCNQSNSISKHSVAALEEYKTDNAQIILYYLGCLAQDNPEISDTIRSTIKKFKLVIPSRCTYDTARTGYSSPHRVRHVLSSTTPITITQRNTFTQAVGNNQFATTVTSTGTLPSLTGSMASTRGAAVKQTNISLNI